MSDVTELQQPYLELLKHIIKYFDDPTTDGLIFASSIRTIAERGFNVGLVRSGLAWLTEHGFLDVAQESTQNEMCWKFSSKGTAVAYDLITVANTPSNGDGTLTPGVVPVSFNGSPVTFNGAPVVWSGQLPEDTSAPMAEFGQTNVNLSSDLFREIDHGSAEFKDLIKTLDRLSSSVSGSNQLSISKEDRLCVLSDITRFRDLLHEPRVRIANLSAFITGDGTGSWLARESIGGVVRAAALEVVKAVWKLITSLVGAN